MSMRTSMRDIARRLGVSVTTVSRALKGDGRVKATTRVKIESCARELGYEPDPALAALNAYREGRRRKAYHGIIAWLTNYPEPEGWRSVQTNVDFYNAIQKQVTAYGYGMEALWLHPVKMPAARLDQILRSRGIRGIFLSSLPEGTDTIEFPWEHYCMVSLSETVQSPVTHSVQKSAYFDVRTAVRQLAAAGYTRPILVAHDRYHFGMHNVHLGAFVAATRELLGSERPCFHCRRVDLARQLDAWIESSDADAVISTVEPPTAFCARRRRPVWVGFTGSLYEGADAAVVHETETLVKTGLDFMTGMIQRGEFGLPEHPVVLRLQGKWKDRSLKR